MTDRADVLTRNGITNRHFLFTVEAPTVVDRVIASARTGAPVGVRRAGSGNAAFEPIFAFSAYKEDSIRYYTR